MIDLDLTDLLDALKPAWMEEAACRDTPKDVFFPHGAGRGRPPKGTVLADLATPARDICAGCPVRDQCLEYALANHIDHGVWGGESERSRRRIRKARRLAA